MFVGWRLRSESETVVRDILPVKLQIERDPAAPSEITFSDPGHADWIIHAAEEGILEHELLQQQPHTRDQTRNLQSGRELKRALKITGICLGGFALAALAVSLLLGWMVRSLVARIPVEWEQELGDKLILACTLGRVPWCGPPHPCAPSRQNWAGCCCCPCRVHLCSSPFSPHCAVSFRLCSSYFILQPSSFPQRSRNTWGPLNITPTGRPEPACFQVDFLSRLS